MNTANQECIWKDQCGGDCPGRCSDYTPADDTEENEAFYARVLRENAETYQEVIKDYSDGEADCQ